MTDRKLYSSLGYTSCASNSVRQECLAIGLFVLLVSYFWWPALADGKVILHADSAHHGLSLLTMLHQWLHHELDSLLWSSGMYGGHPLFAESQGGFLNPTNIFAAYFFKPTDALGVVHWLDMLMSGLGVYVLCRLLNIGSWPALFAACAVTHGTIWLMAQSNLTVHGSLVWVAWTMAAVQFWLNSPSLVRAVLMAVPASFLVYSGYPHLAHGLAVYFLSMVIAWLMRSEGRAYLSSNFRALVLGSVTAVLVALCLSAIQFLPLLELVQNSHRSEGVDQAFGGFVSAKSYFSGTLFFSWYDRGGAPIGLFGILSASILVALCAIIKVSYKITSYLLATFILYNLGIGDSSPLFLFVYEYNLVPGLRGFRIMQPFLLIAVVGFGVLAAYVINGLSLRSRLIFVRVLGGSRIPEIPALATFFLLCLLGSYYFFMPSMSGWNYVFGVASLSAILLLMYAGKRQWIGSVMALLLIVEILVLRNGIYRFYDVSVLAQPESVTAIQQDKDYQDFYGNHLNSTFGYVFLKPDRPRLDKFYREYLGSIAPFPALLWGIPSINGALALELHRRAILDDTLRTESLGISNTPAGGRLIDVLGVRYFSFNKAVDIAGFTLMYSNSRSTRYIYRNDYAMPKLRTYFSTAWVQTPDEALELVPRVSSDTIVLESDTPLSAGGDIERCLTGGASSQIERSEFSSQYYKLVVESPCAGWLYLGDAYYPGWSAIVDGIPAELYPAQVLGKAVKIPQGTSVVEFVYKPYSFYTGVIISGVAWLVLLLFLFWRGIRVVGSHKFRYRQAT